MQIKGLEARKAALEVIQAVGGGAFADVALDRTFRGYSFKSIDKALITELSYGAIRQRYFLDRWIDFLGKVSSDQKSIFDELRHKKAQLLKLCQSA